MCLLSLSVIKICLIFLHFREMELHLFLRTGLYHLCICEGPDGVNWELGFGKMFTHHLGKWDLGHWDWESQTDKHWNWDLENRENNFLGKYLPAPPSGPSYTCV